MKAFAFIILCLITFNLSSIAQNQIVDTNPTAIIYAIDYSTGQEAVATGDQAILFKNALIDLVTNTTTAKMQFTRAVPGRKTFVVTQMDPQAGNAYQLTLQTKFLGQTNIVYTFVYDVDGNSLSYFNPQSGGYIPVPVDGLNLNNLNNCSVYGKFNMQQQQQPAPPPVPSMQTADATGVDASAAIDVNVSTNTAPPALPAYEQPECPEEGYLWQPGFWSFNRENGYYWVPGAWVAPPNPGLLWTPPYWGFEGGLYLFHAGYWGNNIGFYGGLNYGFGYGGIGFVGGEWRDGHFRYNSAVLRIGPGFRNRYEDRTVIFVGERNRASFNGRGGIMARPNERELAAMHERHIMATPEQISNQRAARVDRAQFASANGGRPSTFASPRALEVKQPVGARTMDSRPGTAGGQEARPGMPGNNANTATPGGRPGTPATPVGTNNTNVRPGTPTVPGGVNSGSTTRPGEATTPGGGSNNANTREGTPTAPGGFNNVNTRPGTPAVPGGANNARPGVPAVPGGYNGAKPGMPGNTNGGKPENGRQNKPPAKQGTATTTKPKA